MPEPNLPARIVRADSPHANVAEALPATVEPIRSATPPALAVDLDLVDAILATLGQRTARTYMADYRDFARFLSQPTPEAALNILVSLGPGPANKCALTYRVHLTERGLASGTIARRLTALRVALKRAREIGVINFGLDVAAPRVQNYRDTRGPSASSWRSMLALARSRTAEGQAKPLRDFALVRLLADLALRRGEAVGLDLDDLDIDGRTIAIVGKGKTSREKLTLPQPTADALRAWVDVRGPEPGPLFTPLDPGASPTGRLTGEAVRLIVRGLAEAAGVSTPVRPHGLRHMSITRALDSGRDVRDVRKFSRHCDIKTVLIYDDNRRDVAGEIASACADD